MISLLLDDVLLEIFHFCQMNHDPGPQPLALPEAVWDWHILVHVCQRWRQVVFASPVRLNLRILCTYGTPVRRHLDIWPAFPIQIEYTSSPRKVNEDDVIAALGHPDRVNSVYLWLSRQQLRKIAMVMQEPFPALRHLSLSTDILSNDIPVLPHEFLGRSAPCLQTIHLSGIPFPALPALLLSTRDLVTLNLLDIPQTGYIPPQALVAALATLTGLKNLRFGFQSPASRPDQIRLPPVSRTIFPALTSFHFHGVREYLEEFLAQIYAPLLSVISIYYFNQLVDFEVPQLWQFIERTEDLSQSVCCFVQFQHDYVNFSAGPTANIAESFDYSPRCIQVRIRCEGIDRQFTHISQVLNQLSNVVLSNMLHFAIYSDGISPEPEDMDDTEWLQLLRPFSSVKTLFVPRELTGHVSHALEEIAGAPVMGTEFMPALGMLCLEDQTMTSIDKFIATRLESGRPVTTVDTRMAFQEKLTTYLN
ncbi:hypothetical protein V8E53_005855 [Lactarius tabidus]